MSGIIILDPETINQIAAGEVIERPASVVKELVENSIDAAAQRIDIEIRGSGLTSIKITDNGTGMSRQDAMLAIKPHATSKIKKVQDLLRIQTLGFRGEALSSIASVSRLRLRTCQKGELSGTEMFTEGGEVTGIHEIGCAGGTEVMVESLFFNTPARRKFLKKPSLEAGRITDLVNRMAMSYPKISFSLEIEGRQVLKTRGSGNLLEIISQVYGREKTRYFIPVDYKQGTRKVLGYTAKPYISRSNRSHQNIFINGRVVKSVLISRAVEEAYGTLLPRNSYPAAVLFISLEPEGVDVNVHPGKAEVRFADEKEIHQLIFHSINQALKNNSLIPEISRTHKSKEKFFEQVSLYSKGVNIKEREDLQSIHQQGKHEEKEKEEMIVAENVDVEEINKDKVAAGISLKDSEAQDDTGAEYDVEEYAGETAENINIVGQFLGTYILAQKGQDLLLVDQHAAHERILYEKLKGQFNQEIKIQETLPTVLELPAGTGLMAEEILEFCRGLNFQVELFGSDSLVLRGVPHFIKDIYQVRLVEELICSFCSEGRNQEQAKEESIIMMACKAACKANMKMTQQGMEALMLDLFKTEVPYTCPHGRPTMIVLTRGELEKSFKR